MSLRFGVFWAALLLPMGIIAPTDAGDERKSLTYPETNRVNHTDTLHGIEVADPYRWLEADVRESDAVRDWVTQQNEVTFGYLRNLPAREPIRERLTKLWNYEKFGSPFQRGGRYYHYYNSGLQNQYVLRMQATLDADPEILIDPNTWSDDGTVALAGTSFSEDGRYVAYGIQDAGSDWRTYRILDIPSKQLLDDRIEWVKFSGIAWKPDGSGFFYGRYPEVEADDKFQTLNLGQQIYFHRVGTPQSEDVLTFEAPGEPEWTFDPDVTHDGRYLVISIRKGTDDRNRVVYRDLRGDHDAIGGAPVTLIDSFDNEYSLITSEGSTFYFLTDLDAPKKRVVTIDLTTPETITEIIPESDNVMVSLSHVGDRFFAKYLKDARTEVRMFSLEGKDLGIVELPGIGTASGFGGRPGDEETFYSFSSYSVPPSTYRFDLKTGRSERLQQAKVDFDPERYVTKQVFYTSADGTKIPMFITHRKGMPLDGQQPTLLYGYGGFSIPLTPGFSITRLAWLEMGGVYAVANLRGGGEYGEDWHRAGIKLKKQNVFDDFIAAAEYLIAEKYTSTPRLAIQGGSNGGLLVGACLTQRPDLFGACLPAVGVMDMLRFHKFTAGRFWVDDFGSPDDPEEFKALLAYSPYHNLRPGTKYPATLVTTADTDDRVVPSHSFKFAARLQECQAGDDPVLIRIETRAGHGSGKPTALVIEEAADVWAFLVRELDFEPAWP